MTAAVRNAGGSVALTNVTAVDSAVGVAHSSGSTAVRNCIVYGNTAQISGSPTVTYSDVEGGFSGTGNMDKDPVFKSPGMEDYHLTVASPCIDAGDPGDSYANEPEPNGGRIDMGAYGNTSRACLSLPGSATSYDHEGNVIARRDELEDYATFVYDDASRQVAATRKWKRR